MSEVVAFLSNIPRLREEAPPQKQENGRYTLASLMDRMDSVPPITGSLQLLPHTPMTHPQQHAAGMLSTVEVYSCVSDFCNCKWKWIQLASQHRFLACLF